MKGLKEPGAKGPGVSERTQKDTELVDGNIYDRRMSEGASPAGFSASLGTSVNEERSCARKPNNIVVNASCNRLARKPYAGNPHVRFEEGEGSSRTLSTLLQTSLRPFVLWDALPTP